MLDGNNRKTIFRNVAIHKNLVLEPFGVDKHALNSRRHFSIREEPTERDCRHMD